MSLREDFRDTCRLLGYDPEEVRGPSKARAAVERRRAVCFLLRPRYSLPEIGRAVNRDHATVLYLLRGGRHRQRVTMVLMPSKVSLVEAGCGL